MAKSQKQPQEVIEKITPRQYLLRYQVKLTIEQVKHNLSCESLPFHDDTTILTVVTSNPTYPVVRSDKPDSLEVSPVPEEALTPSRTLPIMDELTVAKLPDSPEEPQKNPVGKE